MKPLVSIIIPLYNAAPYIKETLDSVLASTYRPIEVVIVDDGSQDDSLRVARDYCLQHTLCRVLSQPNAGVSAARNHAIREAKGKYILPVDADDKIGATYIEHAVEVLEQQDDIRIVGCRAMMFGEVNKEWQLPTFSHALLARKNMIPVTSLFRRSDWEQVGGFCEEDIYREDWDFWLSLMEQGGTFHKLDEIGLYYRVRKGSRRATAKQQKHLIVDAINRRHSAYMQQYLGGPLHYHRSWSRLLNCFRSEKTVGDEVLWQEGGTIYQGRNTLRRNGNIVTKSFAIPPLWRGILYGVFCKSKARRSYEYALRMEGLTPAPIAYREVRYLGILRESEYACKASECTHTFNELISNPQFPNRKTILQAIGRFTAQLHRRGVLHKDYSGGNILFNEDGTHIEIVDLNRIRFCRRISIHQGLRNFERLNIDREALTIMAQAYAQAMGYDPDYCSQYIIKHRWHKHVKQGITHL
ncbi:MAG: glycosyltransferase [Paludibacteraceae bacterium]